MIQYGLISRTDAATLEKTIDLICDAFPMNENIIHTCQIGIFDGQTDRGIYEYIKSKFRNTISIGVQKTPSSFFECNHTCIDNNKDKEVLKPFPECTLIIGNSNEVYNALADNSQHLCFVDGDHSYIGVISDFFAYKKKIKIGGFLCFHDTSPLIKQFKDWQRKGSEGDADQYISVRKALTDLGMFEDVGYELFPNGTVSPRYMGNFGFRLIFDEYDPNDEAGGIICFQRKK